MDDHKRYLFNELKGTTQGNIITLLQCAIRDPDHHVIHCGKSGHKTKPYGFRVEIAGDFACAQVSEDWDLGYWLLNNGFVGHGPVDWKTLRFRPEILAWYRVQHPLSEAEEQAEVGKYFRALAVSDDDMERFDPNQVAAATNLSPERVVVAVRSLVGRGLLFNDGPRGSGVAQFFKLTQDGHRWASASYPADFGAGTRVDLHVNLHVEIEQVIEVIAELQIPEEQRKAYELTVLKLERELQRDNVTWDTTKDALEMAAHAKEVAVPIITLLAAYKDQILQAIAQAPIL